MKLTLRDIVDSKESLSGATSQKPTARMAYTLGLVLNAVNPHLIAYGKAIESVKERYFKPDPKNAEMLLLTTDEKERAKYKEEIDALLESEVNLDGVGRIKASTLDAEGVKLTPQDIYALRWLIKMDMEALFEKED